jgi:hypothetical protein
MTLSWTLGAWVRDKDFMAYAEQQHKHVSIGLT